MDGDTVLVLIELRWGVWVEKAVRIKGIESYELCSPDEGRARACAAKLNKLFGWKDCVLVPSQEGLDRYGRIIGDVMVEGKSLAQSAVDQLCAWYGAPGSKPCAQDARHGPISKPSHREDVPI